MVALTMWQLAQASLATVALLQSTVEAQITSDTYFYGDSPPVYPSPAQPGKTTWASAHSKAVAMVSKMTLAEKASLTSGVTPQNGCSGMTAAVTRVGFPGMCIHDAGNGVRNADFVNSWPSGMHVGASWNRDLAYQRALRMGGEFKTKGVNVALGPVVGPLGRIAMSGRNWEGFSVDPYLCGALAAETVTGLQKADVVASVKHFIGNEQETNRMPAGITSSTSSNIDDKTMHELYLWPFQDAIHAGAGSVMCAYTGVNNSNSCQNSKLMNGLLKTELGFEGFVVSDWGAQYTGMASALAGMDVAMPNSNVYWGADGSTITVGVNNGTLNATRVTDMAVRLISSWYLLGQDSGFPTPGVGLGLPGANILATTDYYDYQKHVNARDPDSKPYLLSGAEEGHVLVKNTNNALPLNKPKLVSVFGYDAISPATVNVAAGSDFLGGPFPFGFWSLLGYMPYLSPAPLPSIAKDGTLITGGGSGSNSPAYISAPFDAIKEQAYDDGTSVLWDFASQTPVVDSGSDACLVFINAFASEGYDRIELQDDYSDTLVNNVANSCKNTIVTIHNAGIRLVESWADHENVTAIIYAHLPGQDSGRALVRLLYGQDSFSGKLPYTVAKSESDYINAGQAIPVPTDGDYLYYPQANFTEGVYIDYKDFDAKNITPRYEFGFGLSYGKFEYSNLDIDLVNGVSTSRLPPSGQIVQGGLPSLWTVVAKIKATIKNSGSMDAMEVAQLYIGIPGGPIRQLRGFEKVSISKGDRETVEFDLTRRDLSSWNATLQTWVLDKGTYNVYVGGSSRSLPLHGTMKISN